MATATDGKNGRIGFMFSFHPLVARSSSRCRSVARFASEAANFIPFFHHAAVSHQECQGREKMEKAAAAGGFLVSVDIERVSAAVSVCSR